MCGGHSEGSYLGEDRCSRLSSLPSGVLAFGPAWNCSGQNQICGGGVLVWRWGCTHEGELGSRRSGCGNNPGYIITALPPTLDPPIPTDPSPNTNRKTHTGEPVLTEATQLSLPAPCLCQCCLARIHLSLGSRMISDQWSALTDQNVLIVLIPALS